MWEADPDDRSRASPELPEETAIDLNKVLEHLETVDDGIDMPSEETFEKVLEAIKK